MTNQQLQNAAYDLYYAHWVLTHQTRDEILDTIANYHEALAAHEFIGTLSDYLNDFGFSGSAPVCKDEFLNTEFKDEQYMQNLLAPYDSGEHSLLTAYNKYKNSEITRTPVRGRVVKQSWIHDYAVTEGEDTFDCVDALDTFSRDSLPQHADDLHEEGILNYGDDIFHAAVSLGLTDEWNGPFEFYIDDDEQYQTYLATRQD